MSVAAKVRLVVAVCGGAGLATVLAALATGQGRLGPLAVFVPLTVLLGLNWAFPLLVLWRDETEAFQLDEAFFVAMVLLLPPLGVVVAFAAATAVSQLARRRPLPRITFNTGQAVAAAGLGLAVQGVFGPADGSVSALALVGTLAGALTFLVVNSSAISVVIALTEGRTFTAVARDGFAARLGVWTASVSLGLLAGLSASAYPWALGLAAVPLAVLQVVLARDQRARRDRERMEGLFRTAIDVHASMRLGDVEAALTGSAEHLLKCRAARVGDDPPGPGDLGARIQSGAHGIDRWLVVSDRKGYEPFTASDARLLDAIAAVGVGALENAGLVEQIQHESLHDALTGLPNQLLFEERVDQSLRPTQRTGEHVAVMVVDLDHFKKVNDSLGHAAGNALLQQVAARLQRAVRDEDTVARMGGDEFTILLPRIAGDEAAATVAAKIVAAFRPPFVLAHQELFITPSIGIAVSPHGGTTPGQLLKNADAAMYQAKDRGRNNSQPYAASMNSAASDRLTLEANLHRALDEGSLAVYYQPQFDLRTGALAGVEALVRWPHPTRGQIPPDEFIGIAEETGLIIELDRWVMRTACAQVRAWSDAGLPSLRVAVNISGRHFENDNLVAMVTDVLRSSRLEAHRLEVEITESVAVEEVGGNLAMLESLRALGIQIAIDDFGTGYSILSRLRTFPLDRLKIDRSFVAEITGPDERAPIVAAMISMAHALDLEVVAEGVETPAQQAFLAQHGCDLAQGYLLSRPIDGQSLEALLRQVAGSRAAA